MRDQQLWTWHVVAGLVIFIFLGLHMAIMHLDQLVGIFNQAGTEAIGWANVAARAKMGFFRVSYVVLLGAALFHGLYGLRNILFELAPGPSVKNGLNAALTIGGVGLFAFGAWAAWAASALAKTQ